MTKPVSTSKSQKPKQEFVYFIDSRWSGFGAGIDCINSKEIFPGPNKTFMAVPLDMQPDGINPMVGIPVMQFEGRAQKYHEDFEVVGGVWVLSPPVREFFEGIDAGAFTFRECKTQYPDGSPAPPRSLVVVKRVIDAFDRERSEFRINPYDPKQEVAAVSSLNENYFKKAVIGDFHFFVPAKTTTNAIVSQAVKDEFKKQGWKGADFSKAFLS